jgi:hypothetical protein
VADELGDAYVLKDMYELVEAFVLVTTFELAATYCLASTLEDETAGVEDEETGVFFA